ncbi:hypothetical protein GCM10027321_15510 [Massilia terrae]
MDSHTGNDFDISFVQNDSEIENLSADWNRLLDASRSPEKIYQSPAFFRYLKETSDPCALLVARCRGDGEVIGIVPVRPRCHSLEFRMGPLGSPGWKLPVVQVLGSVPLLQEQRGLLDAVVQALFAHFPEARGLSLQAVPSELFGQFGQLDGMGVSVLDGWRECHTLPLPENFDAYLQKLSSKKRYNIQRQVRQLAAEAGEIEVVRIERPEQVAPMFDALRALMPATEFAAFPAQFKFERLAACGLLFSCMIRCAGVPVGVVVGSNGIGRWMIHNIVSDGKYQHLSAGTSTMHLALKEMMAAHALAEADFGYGTPNRDFRSSHELRTRGHVLVWRRAGLTPAVLACNVLYGKLYDYLASSVKRLKKRVNAWRARRKA